MGKVNTEYPNSVIVIWEEMRVVTHLTHVTASLCEGHVEWGDGVREPLWKCPDMLVHVATNVGVHLSQDEGFYAVEQEGPHGVDDSLQKRNTLIYSGCEIILGTSRKFGCALHSHICKKRT